MGQGGELKGVKGKHTWIFMGRFGGGGGGRGGEGGEGGEGGQLKFKEHKKFHGHDWGHLHNMNFGKFHGPAHKDHGSAMAACVKDEKLVICSILFSKCFLLQ